MQNQAAISLKSSLISITPRTNNGLLSPYPHTLQNPRLRRKRNYSVLNCTGIEILVPKARLNSLSFCNGSVEDEKLKAIGVKEIDVATLGNLCVDIVLNVPKLPPKPLDQRQAYMEQLSKSPPDKVVPQYKFRYLTECFYFSCLYVYYLTALKFFFYAFLLSIK